MATQDTLTSGLPQDLSARLELIVQTLPHFWAQRRYNHVIDHGPLHSERVHSQKLAQLAQELPERSRLTNDEIFIVSAAARLYEIGLQSPNLRAVLGFDPIPNQVTPAQLRQIRSKKHELSARLILDSVSPTYKGPELSLGLARPADEYTDLIALVCRNCSDEPLDEVPEMMAVRGLPIRLRLLVALLRLADQLYIDKARINIELLMLRLQAGDAPANAELSPEELAHLWMYNYVQTLPIGNGQIPFHYFLPAIQREYLGHVRGMIERRFQRPNNASLRYVWDKYGLVLVPGDTPVIQFDQPGGFRHPMPEQVKLYLREQIEPIDTPIPDGTSTARAGSPQEERSLLILDYEQLVLQLGIEGYFPGPDDIGRLATQLRAEALAQYGGSVDGIAVGHWGRPDLRAVSEVLYENLYDPDTVNEGQAPHERIQELLRAQHGAVPGQRLILIAPRRELARAVKEVTDRGRAVTTWIGAGREAEIFRGGVGQKHAQLAHVLQLSNPRPLDPQTIAQGELACILRLDVELTAKRPSLSTAEFERFLASLGEVAGRTEWWRLWLVSRGLLRVADETGAGRFSLNREHPLVARTRDQRKALVCTLRKLQRGAGGVRQDELFVALNGTELFNSEEQMIALCLNLKDEGLLQRDARPSLADSQPQWFLAASVAPDPEHYLPLFVLALDHTLVREGLLFLHEHVLVKRLAPALGAELIGQIYQQALDAGWVEARDSGRQLRTSNRPQINVEIVERHPGPAAALRNRDIFVNFLSHRNAAAGLPWDELYDRLSRIKAFTVQPEEFGSWVEFLVRDGVLALEQSSAGREVVKLGAQSPDSLVNYLRGRANVYGLIRNIRRLRATSEESRVRAGELVDRMARYVTGGDRRLAEAAMDYAVHTKLVQLVREETPEGPRNFAWLSPHPLVQRLDRRERSICQALVELLGGCRGDREGFVQRYVVQQTMEQDPTYGYSRGEHDYWIDQAVHRLKLIEERREPDPKRGMQSRLRIIAAGR